MILCNYKEREQRIFDWVQTYLAIADEHDLQIISVEPSPDGFEIDYRLFMYDEWHRSNLTLFNSQILLFESFRK